MHLGALRSFPAVLAAALLGAVLVLGATPLGAYLDSTLLVAPLMHARQVLGVDPRLHPDLRIIAFDDRAMKTFGHTPTFADWYGVARSLIDAGYETVIIDDMFNVPGIAEAPMVARHAKGRVIVGASVYPSRNNDLARPVGDLPARFLLQGGAPSGASLQPVAFLLRPHDGLLPFIDGIGSVNLSGNAAMPIGYAADDGRILPNIALLAAPGLGWRRGHFADQQGTLAVSYDGLLRIEFLSIKEVYAKATSFASLLDGNGRVPAALPAKARSRLLGGRIAVLAPDAYTGSRFIESPAGDVPSFVAIVSAINGVLTHRLLRVPLPPVALLVVVALLLFAALHRWRTWRVVTVTAIIAVLQAGLAIVLLHWFAILLPAAEIALILGAGVLAGAARCAFDGAEKHGALVKELEIGSSVQALFMPARREGRIGNWEFNFLFRPHGAMAGDWVQVFPLAGAGLDVGVIAIGDVVGKGASAALLTAVIASTWNRHATRWAQGAIDVPAFCRDLNESICTTFHGDQNTTLSLAVLAPDEIQLVACASPGWLRWRPGTRADVVRARPSSPLGWSQAEAVLDVVSEVAQPADLYIAYTDGVIERARQRKKLIDLLSGETADGRDAPAAFAAVTRHVAGLAAQNEVPDDFTLLMIRRAG